MENPSGNESEGPPPSNTHTITFDLSIPTEYSKYNFRVNDNIPSISVEDGGYFSEVDVTNLKLINDEGFYVCAMGLDSEKYPSNQVFEDRVYKVEWANIYEISTIADLQDFAESSRNENRKDSAVLLNDLDLSGYSDRIFYIKGCFDGNDKTLSNLKLNIHDSLIFYNYGTIMDLNFSNAEIQKIAIIESNELTGTVKNVSVTAKIIDNSDINSTVAGIVYNNYGLIDACDVTLEGNAESSSGGIAYKNLSNGIISNSTAAWNYSPKEPVGGIAEENWGKIINCSSSGSINVDVDNVLNKVGGISSMNSGSIINSSSSINITGSGKYFGGIAGQSGGNIEGCTFSGSVTNSNSSNSDDNSTGGIVGCNNHENAKVINCKVTSTGSIKGGLYSGGIVGLNDGSATIIACINESDVTTSSSTTDSNVGGIVGKNNNSYVVASVNKGSISGGANSGGICGYSFYRSVHLNSCLNDGTVSGTNKGGIVGYYYCYDNIQASYTTTKESTGIGYSHSSNIELEIPVIGAGTSLDDAIAAMNTRIVSWNTYYPESYCDYHYEKSGESAVLVAGAPTV